MAEQVPFGTNDFAENPEPRCPCVLLLDTSGSMQGDPIDQLNAGLVTYKDELAADSLAAKRVEVAIVTSVMMRWWRCCHTKSITVVGGKVQTINVGPNDHPTGWPADIRA